MRKLITFVILCGFSFLAQSKIIETAYEFGFIEKYKVAVLAQGDDSVKCRVFAWGFIKQEGLEDKYHKCIADYKNQGYKLVSQKGT